MGCYFSRNRDNSLVPVSSELSEPRRFAQRTDRSAEEIFQEQRIRKTVLEYRRKNLFPDSCIDEESLKSGTSTRYPSRDPSRQPSLAGDPAQAGNKTQRKQSEESQKSQQRKSVEESTAVVPDGKQQNLLTPDYSPAVKDKRKTPCEVPTITIQVPSEEHLNSAQASKQNLDIENSADVAAVTVEKQKEASVKTTKQKLKELPRAVKASVKSSIPNVGTQRPKSSPEVLEQFDISPEDIKRCALSPTDTVRADSLPTIEQTHVPSISEDYDGEMAENNEDLTVKIENDDKEDKPGSSVATSCTNKDRKDGMINNSDEQATIANKDQITRRKKGIKRKKFVKRKSH